MFELDLLTIASDPSACKDVGNLMSLTSKDTIFKFSCVKLMILQSQSSSTNPWLLLVTTAIFLLWQVFINSVYKCNLMLFIICLRKFQGFKWIRSHETCVECQDKVLVTFNSFIQKFINQLLLLIFNFLYQIVRYLLLMKIVYNTWAKVLH